ncbi:MAG: amidohydrolase family protein [Hyphomicrobiales bacterium]
MSELTIARGRWVICGAGDDDVITDGAVLFEGDGIEAVGPWAELSAAHPDAAVVGSDRVALMPGLINAHHHSSGSTGVQQGVPDLHLEPWLLARNRLRPQDVQLATLISAARLLASGVTTVVDVHSGSGTAEAYAGSVNRALEGYDLSGMRTAFTAGTSLQSHLISGAGEDDTFIAGLPEELRGDARAELPAPGSIDGDDYLGIMDDLMAVYREHARIDIWYGPPGPQWVSDDLMQQIAEAAGRHDTNIQTHVAESFYEKLHGPRGYGKPTALHLNDLGVLGPRFSIAHGVWLSEPEIAVMAETGAGVSHNPSSNLRLRAGIAPLNALREAGVTVGLGMDGTSLNDDEDMFTEMRLALRLHRGPELGMPAPEPEDLLHHATVGGAKLMRKESRLGRLAPGFAADLVMVDLEKVTWPWVSPEIDPRELILMRAKASDVDAVYVGGELVCQDGRPTRFDADEVAGELAAALGAAPFPEEGHARAERLMPHVEAYYREWEVPGLQAYTAYNSRK